MSSLSAPFQRFLTVTPSFFSKANEEGDFLYMLKKQSTHYMKKFFIYNENFTQWLNKNDLEAGAGNGALRPYRKTGCVGGIPTGHNGMGFKKLTQHVTQFLTVKNVIDLAIQEIVDQLKRNSNIEIVYFSADARDLLIGMGVFMIGHEVREYITQQIYLLPIKVQQAANTPPAPPAPPAPPLQHGHTHLVQYKCLTLTCESLAVHGHDHCNECHECHANRQLSCALAQPPAQPLLPPAQPPALDLAQPPLPRWLINLGDTKEDKWEDCTSSLNEFLRELGSRLGSSPSVTGIFQTPDYKRKDVIARYQITIFQDGSGTQERLEYDTVRMLRKIS